jgi:CheY-like chemotaxis protein
MISVLVVDDFLPLTNIICLYLERGGDIIVDISNSTGEALRKMEYIDFDAVVTDYNLKDGSGIDLIRFLRGRGSQIPVLYFTIEQNPALMRQAKEFGNVAFVEKLDPRRSNFPMLEQIIREMVPPRQEDCASHAAQSVSGG